jgi:pyruvate,orthophosphate dikinase
MGKCCVVGAGEVLVDEEKRAFQAGRSLVTEGNVVSLNGSTGEVILGAVPLVEPALTGEFQELLAWADEVRTTGVRANADTPEDARKAREFGAEGIGLTRTEHMFFKPERIPIVREMIMASDAESRRRALEKLLPVQRDDFRGIFKVMAGLPVTIRLLDPPLHEFLPHYDELLEEHTRLEALGKNPARSRSWRRSWPRCAPFRSSTPCWATAAVASALPSRRSTRCRSGPSSKLLAR